MEGVFPCQNLGQSTSWVVWDLSSGKQVWKQKFVSDFDQTKSQFIFDVKAIIEDILAELVIKWDQTGIDYVPVSSWTMEKEGSKWEKLLDLRTKTRVLLCLGAQWLEIFFLLIDVSREYQQTPSIYWIPFWLAYNLHRKLLVKCTIGQMRRRQ